MPKARNSKVDEALALSRQGLKLLEPLILLKKILKHIFILKKIKMGLLMKTLWTPFLKRIYTILHH